MKREDRQRVLQSQYFFTCSCLRCAEKDNDEVTLQFSALLCSYCGGPVMEGRDRCADCCKPQPLIELVNLALTAQEAFNKGLRLLSEKKTNEAKLLVEESVQLAAKCLYKHNSDLRTYKDSLARILAESGQYHESSKLIEENIKSIEKQFGCHSIETCRELIKLFDVVELDLTTIGLKEKPEERRSKIHKMENVFKRVQETIDRNVEAKSLEELSRMSFTLKKYVQ